MRAPDHLGHPLGGRRARPLPGRIGERGQRGRQVEFASVEVPDGVAGLQSGKGVVVAGGLCLGERGGKQSIDVGGTSEGRQRSQLHAVQPRPDHRGDVRDRQSGTGQLHGSSRCAVEAGQPEQYLRFDLGPATLREHSPHQPAGVVHPCCLPQQGQQPPRDSGEPLVRLGEQ
ncbi:hypothetical protein ACFPM0_28540 [Pseudonocardia sulfidoxydans]|uniref:hypothetical protein n=1 Tax=Pseudonocardia sulfidoxydans TaxID=54011 RepID=UPI00360E88A8